MQLVHQYVLESAFRYPEKSALVCDNREVTYATLIANMYALSDVCVVEGLRKGDRVLIMLRDKADFIIAAYAVIRAGGIAVPITERSLLENVQQIAKDCSPFAVITSRNDLIHHPLLRDKLSCNFLFMDDVIKTENRFSPLTGSFHHLESSDSLDRIAKLMNLNENDGALVLYTANSAGNLHGAVFTHKSLIYSSITINSINQTNQNLREFIMHPLSQSTGFVRLRCVLFAGGTAVFDNNPQPSPVQLMQHILQHSCNGISATPEFISTLKEHRDEPLMKRMGTEIHFVEFGASSVTVAEKKQILDMFPVAQIYQQYGSTEVPCSTYMEIHNDRKKIPTVGRAAPYAQISVTDDSGNRLGKGQAGHIIIRGNHGFSGYWQQDNDGFAASETPVPFSAGDIGFLDKDGYLCVLGRKDEIINMAGLKISPIEVEEKIHEIYPDIEICVVGLPDPSGIVGEIPVLCCIADNGKKIITSELSSNLSTRLDKNKIPRIVYRLERFPRVNNVIARGELRKQLLEGTAYSVQQNIS